MGTGADDPPVERAPFFGELYLRSTRPFLKSTITQADVAYLGRCFGPLAVPGPLLDLGCGHGRHLEAGVRAGRTVIGLDFDPLSLAEAKGQGPVVRADFFAPPFRPGSFAGGWCWYNSFATFEDARIEQLLTRVASLIRPGGLWITQSTPRPRAEAEPESHYLGPLGGGWQLLESMRFDPVSGRDVGSRRLTRPDGSVMAADYFIRYYSQDELTAMLEAVGFRVLFVHGGPDESPYTASSLDLIVGAQRG